MSTPATSPRPTQLPPPSQDHFAGLTGANAMATRGMAETEARILKAIKHNAMVCIHGHVGLGKTFAVHTILRRRAPETTVRLRYNTGANMNEIRTHLWSRLGLPGEPPQAAGPCDQQIRNALEAEPRILLIDEAQGLGTKPLEYFRTLWGDDARRAAIVLVGSGNTRQKILNNPALHSRILDWYQFSPLTPTEVQTTIPAYQKIWAEAPPELILYADDMVGHGSFRNWARITVHLQDALEENPKLALNKDLIRWVLSRIDPTTRHTPQRN
ncbi:ATP-binding protein [Streptomyces sp. NRRL B-1381]|uniref:ATP-binding protein n=1 Tax=Streptomyces sp. NRRL B-1381 TaxID=1463829 RepID=UPI0004C19513|nr:ATP-binding protein [Streptomyces sp. NRRL B-1381]